MELRRYPELLGQAQRGRITAQIRARLQTVSTEAVTGLKSDLTQATKGILGEGHLLNKALNDIDQSKSINSLSQTRLKLMRGAVTGGREAINDLHIRGTIMLGSESQIGLDVLEGDAAATLKNVMAAFTIAHGNRYLFSGDLTQNPTFAPSANLLTGVQNILSTASSPADVQTQLDQYFDDPTGPFQTQIYQGSDDPAPGFPLGDGHQIPAETSGNSKAVRDTLRGLAVMASAQIFAPDKTSDDFAAIFNQGIKSLTDGNSGLVSIESEFGSQLGMLDKLSDRLKNEQLVLTSAYQDLFGRDQFEAAGELKSLEAQLEASYAITARLSNLTLTNFLR